MGVKKRKVKEYFSLTQAKFKGDNFRSQLKLPLYFLICSSSYMAHMETFLKIPNGDLLTKLKTLLTWWRNITVQLHEAKNSVLESSSSSSNLTRRHNGNKVKIMLKYTLRIAFCLLETHSILTHWIEVIIHRYFTVSDLQMMSSWQKSGDG